MKAAVALMLALSGCVGTGFKTKSLADVETGPITGLNYQSVLPVGMIVILAVLTIKDAMILWCVLYFSHRREMVRLKKNGA